MINIGKQFEQSFKKSAPNYVLVYRLPDSAQSFGRNYNLRFSRKNPFDYLMWDSQRHILYALELKTVKGISISFERKKDDKKEIHFHQIKGLTEWNKFDGIICGFVIEFRKIEKTVFIDINSFNTLISSINKSSFNFNDLVESKLDYIIIPQTKKRTQYIYDIEKLLENKSNVLLAEGR